ncbi:MAG: lipoyl synthase [Chitinispirillaceae bacterium]|nr:lipoyl synthase [Chitinispirillaceae bacterium]
MIETVNPLNSPQGNLQKKPGEHRRLPGWLKRPLSLTGSYRAVSSCIAENRLNTVCVEARCPNRAECFSAGTATFLIMGSVCTRNCAFCGVRHGAPLPLDPEEPARIAEAAVKLNLRHIVITSVTRDDLQDGGAAHFAACVRQCRSRLPASTVELLIPDFRGKHGALETVAACCPDVIGHNVETAPRLYPRIRPKADYLHSLGLLARVSNGDSIAKSGFMAGLGESDDELVTVLRDLRDAGCRIVTMGQYLQPSKEQVAVERYLSPERFRYFEEAGRAAGLTCVVAGPQVRSSYHAHEVYALTAAAGRQEVPRPTQTQ